MKYCTIREGQIYEIFDDANKNVPPDAQPLNEADFIEIRKAGCHSLFDWQDGRAVRSAREIVRPEPVRQKSELEELRDLVEILAEAMPNKTPQVAEALARISARKSAIER